MKQLLKAVELRDGIVKLDSEILEIEKMLDNVSKNNLKSTIKLEIKENKKESILDEDGSLKMNTNSFNASGFTFYLNGEMVSSNNKSNKDYSKELTDSEFLVMFGSLLNYKYDLRKHMTKEFNDININIKL